MEKGYTLPVLDHGFVRYIDHLGSDERICEAARISYKAPSKGPEADKKLINYLWKNRHTSPFEMAKIQLNIKMPIFVMRQYVRHRMQNLNEVSARYTELPNEFYIPKVWRKQDTKNKQSSLDTGDFNPILMLEEYSAVPATEAFEFHCKQSYKLYESMLESGIAREMARMVLPINIYTEIYTTWDLNNLLKFIVLRDDSHAQYEIQEYGKAMKEIAKELFPYALEAYEKNKFIVKPNEPTPSVS
jgi:thymidylate synthase (FAD)